MILQQKRKADIEDIEKGGDFQKDTRIVENIDDVKEVALSCEKKIKEFKVSVYLHCSGSYPT